MTRTYRIDQIGQVSRQWLENNAEAAREAMVDTALAAQNLYNQNARDRAFDTGRLAGGFHVDPTPDGAELTNDAPYFVPVDEGRKPGSMPPMGPILEWVKRKRLVASRAAVNASPDMLGQAIRVAQKVRWKIYMRGIPAKHIASGAENTAFVMQLMKGAVQRAIRKAGESV